MFNFISSQVCVQPQKKNRNYSHIELWFSMASMFLFLSLHLCNSSTRHKQSGYDKNFRLKSQSIPKRPRDLFPAPLHTRSMAVRLSSQQQNSLLITKKESCCEIMQNPNPMRRQYTLDTTLWSAGFEWDNHLPPRANVISIWINGWILSDAPIRLAQIVGRLV